MSAQPHEFACVGVRQLTGAPHVYHAYVGRGGKSEIGTDINHRSAQTARRAAEKLARHLNARGGGDYALNEWWGLR